MLKEICTARNLTIVALVVVSITLTCLGQWGIGIMVNALAVNMMLWSE